MWLASPTLLQTPHPNTRPKLLYRVWGPLSHTPVHGARWHWWRHTHQHTGWHQGLGVITWDVAPDATRRDPSLQLLLHYICSGFPTSRQSPAEVQEYWQYRDRLSTVDEVFMMDDRTPSCPSRCLLYAELCPSLSVLAWVIWWPWHRAPSRATKSPPPRQPFPQRNLWPHPTLFKPLPWITSRCMAPSTWSL